MAGRGAYGILIALFAGSAAPNLPLHAQEHLTPHTLGVNAEAFVPPSASLADLYWLEGHWEGEALGGKVEEVWSAPRAGAMMGMFRLVEGDSVRFYELMTMVEEEGSLVLKLKHFNADLTGWEERDEVRAFPLVQRDDGSMHFHGMTFTHHPPDSLHIYLAFRGGDGSMREEVFRYRKRG